MVNKFVLVMIFTALSCALAGCDSSEHSHLSNQAPGKFAKAPASGAFSLFKVGNRNSETYHDYYMDVVQPIIAKRCVVCHACTNAPCNLNMTSYQALERGISKDNPYYMFRMVPGLDSRIVNNFSTKEWRSRHFFSVLPDGDPQLSPIDSILYQNLRRGQMNRAYNPAFNEQEIRRMVSAHEQSSYECPVNQHEYADFQAKYPVGGMPCALPAIADQEAQILLTWVANRAKGPSSEAQIIARHPQTSTVSQVEPDAIVAAWEHFFNQDDLRAQLVSRYIYEHVFVTNIHLDENPGEFYRLVRSKTPYPEEIVQISLETPQDDPGPGRVYYRMQKIDRVIEAKSHVVWRLSLNDIGRMTELFFHDSWTVDALPGYDNKNPFAVFARIPAKMRATFLHLNGRTIIQTIARGPVCFKQEHTYGVDQYFFTIFLRPEADPSVVDPELALASWSYFESGSGLVSSAHAANGLLLGSSYRTAYEAKMRQLRPRGLSLDDIWDGDHTDPNALVFVLRHQYTVEAFHSGLRPIPGIPRSVLLLDFATLERRLYNEVVAFKYWGTLKHKLDSWDRSVYLRTESEDLYVSLFPDPGYRRALRNKFTGPAGRSLYWLYKDYSQGRPADATVNYTEDTLLKALLVKMGPAVTGAPDQLNNWPDDTLPKEILPNITSTAEWEMGLRTLTGKTAPYAQFVPNTVYIRLGGSELYSLAVNRGYIPNKIILVEAPARDRQKDIVIAGRGLIGIAPELFFDISYAQAAEFLHQFTSVTTLDEWKAFTAKYKIARSSDQFWPLVDWLHNWQAVNMPVEAGILELKLYDKGDLPF